MAELVQLPLRAGIDEGTDPKALPAGTLLVAENCRQDKAGRIRKRHGTDGLSRERVDGLPWFGGRRLLTDGRSLQAIDDEGVLAYAAQLEAESLAPWRAIDQVPHLQATCRTLFDTSRSVQLCDVATFGDFLVSAYQAGALTTGPIFVQIESISSGQRLLPPTSVTSSGAFPRVLVRASDGIALVLFTDSNGLRVSEVSTSFLTVGTPTTLAAGVSGGVFDACLVGDDLYTMHELASGTNRLSFNRFDASLTLSAGPTNTNGSTAGYSSMCLDATAGEDVIAAWAHGSALGLVSLSLALSVTVGPTSKVASAGTTVWVARISSGTAIFGWSVSASGTYQEFSTANVSKSTHATTSNTQRRTYNAFAHGKPFQIGSRWFAPLLDFVHDYDIASGSTEPIAGVSSVIVEIDLDPYTGSVPPHRHVATLEARTSWFFTAPGYLQKAARDADGRTLVPTARRRREPFAYETIPLAAVLYTLEAYAGDVGRPNALGPCLVAAAGAPYLYDGHTADSYGFLREPSIVQISKTTGGSMATGDYSYIAVYEYLDANGVLHRSGPSAPRRITGVAASGQVTLRISCVTFNGKQTSATGFGSGSVSPVRIAIYRTKVGGSIFYRLTHEPAHNVLFNDPTAANVTFADTKADTQIASGTLAVALDRQPQLYTVGEIGDFAPPSLVTSTVHMGRLSGIGPDRRTVWMSKAFTEDVEVAPGFNEELTLTFDSDKYALASLDERQVVFGPNDIDLVEGDGPDAAGGSNTWRIVRLQTDVGCSNPRSVVATPAGVLFQADDDKIFLLSRGLEVKWIGKAVRDRLAHFPRITSAVLVPRAQEARFTCTTADGASGIVLAFDYQHAAWYVRKYFDTFSETASVGFEDAALIGDRYTMLTADGKVYLETAEHALDDGGVYVSMAVEILVSPGGNLAWHRLRAVQLQGTSISNHDLTLRLARNYGSFEQTKTFAAEGDVTTIGPLEQARIAPMNQKAQAYRVRVEDSEPTTGDVDGGEGFMLEAIGLLIQGKRGPAKTSAGRRG